MKIDVYYKDKSGVVYCSILQTQNKMTTNEIIELLDKTYGRNCWNDFKVRE